MFLISEQDLAEVACEELSNGLDDIELRSIKLQIPKCRRLSNDGGYTEFRVPTDRGNVAVFCRGDTNKPAILTYHDIGMNHCSNFQSFFGMPEMRNLLSHFCVYHVNAPGQEEGAKKLPDDYVYPTMDELARQLSFVICHMNIKSFIGFGVGAGANILARFAKNNPTKVEAMILVNCTSTPASWIEWGYQKVNSMALRSSGMTERVTDYLIWHHFGRNPNAQNREIFSEYFATCVNAPNLSLFINSYICRSDLGIARDKNSISATVLNITGAQSPHSENTVTFNGRLNPAKASWMKLSDCAMVLEEQPHVLVEAFSLFLQGLGYANVPRTSKQRINSKLSSNGSN